MKLAALLGNDTLKQRLSALQAKGKLTHSFLLTGPEGSGRHTLARILCAAMQCTAPGERPCGVCPQCRKVLDGTHPDICIVDDPRRRPFPSSSSAMPAPICISARTKGSARSICSRARRT